MKSSSTHDIASALRVLSQQIHSEDGIANTVCAEASDRIMALVALTSELTMHILATGAHHPMCKSSSNSQCNCTMSKLIAP